MKVAARVIRIVPGATATIEGRTSEGRQVLLQVPGPQAESLKGGEMLVIDWDVYVVPAQSETTPQANAATQSRTRRLFR